MEGENATYTRASGNVRPGSVRYQELTPAGYPGSQWAA